ARESTEGFHSRLAALHGTAGQHHAQAPLGQRRDDLQAESTIAAADHGDPRSAVHGHILVAGAAGRKLPDSSDEAQMRKRSGVPERRDRPPSEAHASLGNRSTVSDQPITRRWIFFAALAQCNAMKAPNYGGFYR